MGNVLSRAAVSDVTDTEDRIKSIDAKPNLLSIPTEIRLQILAQLLTHESKVVSSKDTSPLTKLPAFQILQTCRQLHTEGREFVDKICKQHVLHLSYKIVPASEWAVIFEDIKNLPKTYVWGAQRMSLYSAIKRALWLAGFENWHVSLSYHVENLQWLKSSRVGTQTVRNAWAFHLTQDVEQIQKLGRLKKFTIETHFYPSPIGMDCRKLFSETAPIFQLVRAENCNVDISIHLVFAFKPNTYRSLFAGHGKTVAAEIVIARPSNDFPL